MAEHTIFLLFLSVLTKFWCIWEPGLCGQYSDYLTGWAIRGSNLGRVKRYFFLFSKMSRSALGPAQPPIQWVIVFFFLPGVEQLGHDVGCSPPSSAKVKNEWSYTSVPPCMASWYGQGQLYLWCVKCASFISLCLTSVFTHSTEHRATKMCGLTTSLLSLLNSRLKINSGEGNDKPLLDSNSCLENPLLISRSLNRLEDYYYYYYYYY